MAGSLRRVVVPVAPRQAAEYSLFPRFGQGRLMIMIPREGYFQIGYLIPKGSDARLRARGLEAFEAEVGILAPEADTSHLEVLG